MEICGLEPVTESAFITDKLKVALVLSSTDHHLKDKIIFSLLYVRFLLE